jgi:hypothetical protein
MSWSDVPIVGLVALLGDLLIFSDGDFGCFDEFYEGGNASYMTSV